MDKELETLLKLKGKPYRGRIEEWTVEPYYNGAMVVYGFVYENPRGEDGVDIRTSIIEKMHTSDSIVETKNSYYKLGIPGTVNTI